MARFAFGGVGEANKGELTFVTLPELEAEASADVCVCEFTGGASANETMVGGGLNGLDLVATQTSGVGASVDGWRAIVEGSDQGFEVTHGWINNFVNNANGFSMLWHLRNFPAITGNRHVFNMSETGTFSMWAFTVREAKILVQDSSTTKAFGGCFLGDEAFPLSDDLFFLVSMDYANNLCFFGLSHGSTQPTSFDDFFIAGTNTYSAALGAAVTAAGTFRIMGGVTISSSKSRGCDVKSITAAKFPSVTMKR